MFRRLLLAVPVILATAVSALAIDVNLSFVPSQVSPQERSRMTVNLINSASSPATNVSLSETMTGIFIADTPNLGPGCGGSTVNFSNDANGGTFNIQGATLPSNDVNNGSCSISFDVVTRSRGNRTVSIEPGQATGTIQGAPTSNPQLSTATLASVMTNPTVTLASVDGRYLTHGETGIFRIRITNPNPVSMTNVGFNLPSSVLLNSNLSTNPSVAAVSTCGGTATVQSDRIILSSGTVAPTAFCDFDFPVQVATNPQNPRTFANGNMTVPVSALTTAEGVTNDVARSLTVTTSSGILVEKTFNGGANASQNISTDPLTTLRIRLENYNSAPIPVSTLVDPLPNGMTFDSVQTNGCGGSLSGIGTSNISWTGSLSPSPTARRDIAEVYSCDMLLNVRAPAAGTYSNRIPAGDLSGYRFNQTLATLSASAGTLTASLSARTAANGTQGNWGDTILATLTLTETSGTRAISNLNAPLSFTVGNGFKFQSVVTNSCGGGNISVTPGAGKANDAVSYVNGTVPAGETCVIQVRYITLPDAVRVQNTTVDLQIPANAMTYSVSGVSQSYSIRLTGGYTRQVSPFYTQTQFTPASTGEGGLSRLRTTVTYYSVDGNRADDISFSAPLLNGLLVANTASQSGAILNTCGGTVTAVPGANSFGLSSGAIPGNRAGSCYIDIPVRAPLLPNGSIQDSSTSTIATGNLDVLDSTFRGYVRANVAAEHQDAVNGRTVGSTLVWSQRDLLVTKSFSETIVDGGAPSRALISVSNSGNNAIRLTNVRILDDMTGTDLYVYTTPGATVSGCQGAQIIAAPNGQVAEIRNANINANQTCTFAFNVYSPTGGNHINTIAAGGVTSDEAVSNANPASATLTVLRNVNISKSYSRKQIMEGEESVLTFQFINTNTVPVFGQDPVFEDVLGQGLTAIGLSGNTCGTPTVSTSGRNIIVSGGEFPASRVCEISVRVRGDAPGVYPNTIPVGAANFRTTDGTLTSNTVPATDTLTVRRTPTITKAVLGSDGQAKTSFYPGETGTFRMTVQADAGAYVGFEDVINDPSIRLTSVSMGTCPISNDVQMNGNTLNALAYFETDASCQFIGTFEAVAPGSFDNVISDMRTSYFDPDTGNWIEVTVPGSNTVTGNVLSAVELNKSFSSATMTQYGTVGVSLALNNPNTQPAIVNRLEDAFPDGMTLVPGSVQNTCGFSQVTASSNGVAFEGLTLSPNANCTVTFSASVNVAGSVSNTARIVNPNTADVISSDVVSVTPSAPSFTVVKLPNSDDITNVGDQASWIIRIQNSGNVPLSFGTFEDTITLSGGSQIPVSIIGDVTTPIPAGGLRLLTSLATANQTVFDQNDALTNVVNVTLTAPGDWEQAQSAQSAIRVVRNAEVSVLKEIVADSVPSAAMPNDPVQWRVTVRNTGNVGLNAFDWSDDRVSNSNVVRSTQSTENGDGVFAPNETLIFDVSDVVQAADLTAGEMVNTFTFNASGSGVPLFSVFDVANAPVRANTAPVAVADVDASDVVAQSKTINVLANDTDAENNIDVLSVRIVGAGPDGKLLDVPEQGAWFVDLSGNITFTPVAGFYGNPTPISYTVADDRGVVSQPASVTLTYPVIPAPIATPNAYGPLPTNAAFTFSPTSDDVSELVPLDSSTILIEGVTTYTVTGEGVWAVLLNGIVQFTPEPGFTASPTPVSYTVKNIAGLESNQALITLTYQRIPPVAQNDVLNNLTTGEEQIISVLDNDGDADGRLDPASVLLVNAPGNGKTLNVSGQGTWSVSDDGRVSFLPAAGFTANPTPVSYTVADNDGNVSNAASIVLTFTPRAPVAQADTLVNLTTGQPAVVRVLDNDSDPDGSLDISSVVLVGADGDGKSLPVSGEGVWNVDSAGVITFSPTAGFTANPTPVSYVVRDNDGNPSNPAEIRLSFDPVMPVAANDLRDGLQTNASVTVDILENDRDPDGSLDIRSVRIVGAPDSGTALVVAGQGIWWVNPNGTLTFAPQAGFTSNPTPVSYTVADNDGNVSNAATVTLVFTARVPISNPDVISDLETARPVTVPVLDNDSDPDGDLDPATVVLVNAPGDGKTLNVPDQGAWTVTPDGRVTFTPLPGFTASPTPVSYTVSDNDGNVSSPSQISLNFTPRPPVAVPDVLSGLTTGQPIVVTVLGNDSDPDGALVPASVQIVGAADGGKQLVVLGQGVWTVDPQGRLVFAPEPGFTASPTPVSYTVADNDGNVSNSADVTLLFTPRPPIANPDVVENAKTNTPVRVSVLTNDADPDGNLDVSSVQIVNAPGDGKTLNVPGVGTWSVTPVGEIVFTPVAGFTASPPSVAYTVADNDGNRSEPAAIRIEFAVELPIAVPDVLSGLTTGQPIRIDVLSNDSDPDGSIDPASVVLVGASGDGKTLTVQDIGVWVVSPEGYITFTPAAGFTGNPDSVQYTVADNDGNRSAPASVTLTFAPRAPVANPDLVSGVPTNAPVIVNVLSNDQDPDGALDPASIVLVGGTGNGKTLTMPGQGVWTVDEQGRVTFTPDAGFTGNPTPVSYTVADNDGNRSDPAQVTIRFAAQAPIATDDVLADVPVSETAIVDVLSNDRDPDGRLDPTSVILVGAADGKVLTVPGQGVWRVDASGRVSFTPENGFFGSPNPVSYQVADNDGNLSEPARITVSYQVPVAPVTSDDAVTGVVGQPVLVNVLQNDASSGLALDPRSVRLQGGADNGKTLRVDGEGVWTVLPSGSIRFTPDPEFFGDPTPAFYVVDDISGATSPEARISIDYDQRPSMSAEVSIASVEDVNGDGRNTPGDVATYRFSVTNTGNVPLLNVNVSVAQMRNLVCEPVTVPVGATVTLSCTGAELAFTQADADRGFVLIEAVFTGEALDAELTDQDAVRVEVLAVQDGNRPLNIEVSKRAETGDAVSIGQNVPYAIIVRNLDAESEAIVDVIDRLPRGLSLVNGSAKLSGRPAQTETNGSDIVWDNVRIPAGGQVRLNLTATVIDFDAGVRNVALVTDPDDRNDVVARSESTVEKDERGVPVFECSTVIGRVFEDLNGNAWMDDGERGVGGVRIITARGTSIVTDAHGRYSVPCAEAPSAIGSNIILKVDSRTLPDGYAVTTENPKVVRLTAGKMTDASFGIRQHEQDARTAQITVDARAFRNGEPGPELKAALRTAVANAKGVGIHFEIAYARHQDESRDTARANARALAEFINGLRGARASVSVHH